MSGLSEEHSPSPAPPGDDELQRISAEEERVLARVQKHLAAREMRPANEGLDYDAELIALRDVFAKFAGAAAASAIGARLEALEGGVEDFGRHAGAVIMDEELHPVGGPPARQHHRAALVTLHHAIGNRVVVVDALPLVDANFYVLTIEELNLNRVHIVSQPLQNILIKRHELVALWCTPDPSPAAGPPRLDPQSIAVPPQRQSTPPPLHKTEPRSHR